MLQTGSPNPECSENDCRAKKSWRFFVAFMTLVSIPISCPAQSASAAATADPHIAEAIKQVSADRIQQTIDKLVSFGNRSTLSPQDEESVKAGKGIGAAREWIKVRI